MPKGAVSDIDLIVLFGASGDLAQKMLFPALYRLEERGELSQHIVGVALEQWDVDRFRDHVGKAVAAAIPTPDKAVRSRLLARLRYVSGDYSRSDTFTRLAATVPAGARCLHYLAIPPDMFETVVSGLQGVGLIRQGRILVEKPFGRDLDSARHLNRVLHTYAPEEAIYRIDHFLGKESVENLLAFRYANPLFDVAWNRQYIDHIQVTMAEAFGIETRGRLYESLGVVRDVVQNHLLCLICLLSMEAPGSRRAEAFTTARAQVVRAARALTPADVVYGQYEGYRREAHVAADSNVATFCAFRLAIDSPRWEGVPFFVRAGKGMATTATQAAVVFRAPPPLPFSNQDAAPGADRLVFRIAPSDGVDLLVQTKLPGEGVRLTTTSLTVDYDTVFGRIPLAYERVLDDTLHGDRSMFADEDSVEEAWRVVGQVCDPPHPPEVYPRGSWGPEAAGDLPGEGRAWMDPA